MSHIWGELRIRLRQKLGAFADLYRCAPPKYKNVIWIGIGAASGYTLSLHNKGKLRLPFSTASPPQEKFYLVNKYVVKPGNVKEFETNWNKLAKWTQRTRGYVYTQLYKEAVEESFPLSYLQILPWMNVDDYNEWNSNNKTSELLAHLENLSEKKSSAYTTVFDDSIARMIPP
ncbi:hypothetical protein IE077_002821 [Cardiosporidium cionae]|uniref:Uncharacterized protein n=1 Tax=Cardiosporidium cionae TaxID=476202 RepID=A0ABQ7J9V4_9APIC|nr:hypothetical protein IE077_002821 [Cardiosporidium cionae]|eukprot:KAF8820787.1 hypothetical protein IE077_002821 [Cardiosporidium cionae]